MPVCYFRVPGAALTSYKYNRPQELYTALLSSHFSGMTHSLDHLNSNCICNCLNVYIYLSLWHPTNTMSQKFYSSLLTTHSSRLTHSLKYNRPYKLNCPTQASLSEHSDRFTHSLDHLFFSLSLSSLYLTSLTHSGYHRYLYHQGNEQTTGGTAEAAAKPWLIPAGKYFAAHRPQGQHPP